MSATTMEPLLLFEQDDVTLRQSADEGGSTWAVRRVREAPKAVLLTRPFARSGFSRRFFWIASRLPARV